MNLLSIEGIDRGPLSGLNDTKILLIVPKLVKF